MINYEEKIPKNAQTSAHVEFAASGELWAAEEFLVNYNQSLILKLTEHQQKSRDVLEFGAGIGTLAKLWEQQTGVKPECVEIDPKLRAIVEKRGFICSASLDVVGKRYETIYTSNVLEHIEDDRKILCQLNSKLKAGGSLVIYVPAFQSLYSTIDENIGHFRRYSKKDLLGKLKEAGFEVVNSRYSDSIGFFAWLYKKYALRSSQMASGNSMRIYDKFIFPLSNAFDRFGVKFIFGKNLFVHARKPEA
jgi:SAM-dependent methyltransferase